MFVNFNLYHFWHRPQGIDAANAAVKPGEIDYVTRSRIEVIWGRGDGPGAEMIVWCAVSQETLDDMVLLHYVCTVCAFLYYIIMIYFF